MKEKVDENFCGSRGSCPTELESASVGAADYKFENKNVDFELERTELTRPVAQSPSLLEACGLWLH